MCKLHRVTAQPLGHTHSLVRRPLLSLAQHTLRGTKPSFEESRAMMRAILASVSASTCTTGISKHRPRSAS
jgi:hypothetical protein